MQDADKAHGVSETVKALILTSLNSELATSDCIYIALQHLYPNYLDDQLVPSVLNRGDRSLYDTIRDSQFDVTFRMVTICQTSQRMDEFYSFSYCCSATAQLFSTDDFSSERLFQNACTLDTQGRALIELHDSTLQPTTAKLVVATRPAKECLMYRRESAVWTGTESLSEMNIYVLRALQVRTKKSA